MEMSDGRCLGKVDPSLYMGERRGAMSAIRVFLPSPPLDAHRPPNRFRWTVGELPHMVNVRKVGGSESTLDGAHL